MFGKERKPKYIMVLVLIVIMEVHKMDILDAYLTRGADEGLVRYWVRFWLFWTIVLCILYYIKATVADELAIAVAFFVLCMVSLLVFRIW
jgi:hypothetical protein